MVIRAIKGNAKDGGYDLPGNIHIKKRELDALIMISRGLNNADAAMQLGVSLNTLRNHMYNVVKKLGSNSRPHALLTAIEKGMIEIISDKAVIVRSDDYSICWRCHRAYKNDEARVMHFDPMVIDHVRIELPDKEVCAYEDCNGEFPYDAIEWSRVRESHPEYPEIPEKGIVYDTEEAPWYWIKQEEQYEQYKEELRQEKEKADRLKEKE